MTIMPKNMMLSGASGICRRQENNKNFYNSESLLDFVDFHKKKMEFIYLFLHV